MIVAIGGCSRAGKTTLAEKLMWQCRLRNFQAVSIHLDDFVKKLNEVPNISSSISGKNEKDWEDPASIDTELICNALTFFKTHFDFIFLEGHLVYSIAELAVFFDRQILVEIPEEIFFERRRRDHRWGIPSETDFPRIWHSWEKYGKLYLKEEGLLTVFGNKTYNESDIYNQLKI